MNDRYKVVSRTMVAGRFVDEGEVIFEGRNGVTKEDVDAALAGKFVEKVKDDGDKDVEKTDAAPSLTTAHHTKRVADAEKTADEKAAQKG